MKHMLAVSLITGASLILAASVWAENVTWRDRLELWNNCQQMTLIVESLDKEVCVNESDRGRSRATPTD